MSVVNADYAKHLHESDWLQQAEGTSLRDGSKLQLLGAVKGFKASSVANGQVRITANVRHPKEKMPRGVLVFLSRQPSGQVMVTPNCSCKQPQLCDHVVAVMQEFISATRSNSPRPRPRSKRKTAWA